MNFDIDKTFVFPFLFLSSFSLKAHQRLWNLNWLQIPNWFRTLNLTICLLFILVLCSLFIEFQLNISIKSNKVSSSDSKSNSNGVYFDWMWCLNKLFSTRFSFSSCIYFVLCSQTELIARVIYERCARQLFSMDVF